MAKIGTITFLALIWLTANLAGTAVLAADESPESVPGLVPAGVKSLEGGWKEWTGITGGIFHHELITSLSIDGVGDLWVGTSRGRVLTRSGTVWQIQARLDAQVTAVAVETPSRVWFSTSDGIRRLDRVKTNSWRVTAFRIYYQGESGLVSGGYSPGLDAERLWGYVDGIYIPPRKKTYAPFVISTEHGLFSWAGFYEVWHHFLPHYWGANSAWLDTRDLLPHRRPTCMVEDGAANLWVGTDGDGIVCLTAHARDYAARSPGDNARDGTEFRSFGTNELGCDFTSVADLSPSADPQMVWAILNLRDGPSHVGRFDGKKWTNLPLEPEAHCVAEVKPGVALVGTDRGLFRVSFSAKTVKKVREFESDELVDVSIRRIVVGPDGSVLCTSWPALFERSQAPD